MDPKVNLTKCQNEHHHRGVFEMSLRRFTRKDLRLEGGGG
jgi:hypothetical protein